MNHDRSGRCQEKESTVASNAYRRARCNICEQQYASLRRGLPYFREIRDELQIESHFPAASLVATAFRFRECRALRNETFSCIRRSHRAFTNNERVPPDRWICFLDARRKRSNFLCALRALRSADCRRGGAEIRLRDYNSHFGAWYYHIHCEKKRARLQ